MNTQELQNREEDSKLADMMGEIKAASYAQPSEGCNRDVKNPHTVDAAHRDPAELLAECQKAQAAVAEVREKLRRELETALTR